jgi:cyclophilin family peptidyl-prolyl cis-trans isomerase
MQVLYSDTSHAEILLYLNLFHKHLLAAYRPLPSPHRHLIHSLTPHSIISRATSSLVSSLLVLFPLIPRFLILSPHLLSFSPLLQTDSELLYGMSSEDDGRGSAATTLQFQSYGALGMAREEFAADSASTQFFWLLFESDLTPAGRNLLDGRYALFGYTLDGADLLKDVKEGDIIASAKVTRGIENLVRGSASTAAAVEVTDL